MVKLMRLVAAYLDCIGLAGGDRHGTAAVLAGLYSVVLYTGGCLGPLRRAAVRRY